MINIKRQLPLIRAIIFISIALAILILSLVPKPPEIIREFALSDKVMHLGAYIALAFSMCFILPPSFSSKKTFYSVFISSTMYGAVIEFLQGFTGRTPEGLDLLSDAAGAAIGILLYVLSKKFFIHYGKIN
ncbi:MAG: VanZ family protein [Spirochaetota bacterium]|nr:VanZ family protein [Spirochaetota bacterium]